MKEAQNGVCQKLSTIIKEEEMSVCKRKCTYIGDKNVYMCVFIQMFAYINEWKIYMFIASYNLNTSRNYLGCTVIFTFSFVKYVICGS